MANKKLNAHSMFAKYESFTTTINLLLGIQLEKVIQTLTTEIFKIQKRHGQNIFNGFYLRYPQSKRCDLK